MNTQTFIIPKSVASKDDLVVIPKVIYNEFLQWKKFTEKRLAEEKDIDEAIRIYKQEKKTGKLKLLKSLTDLD
ncbi:MAG: hypothetical protein HY773_02850 [Candidatus Terrybacteria bacterium]|nr:hypothetical protein [Candidatus Terrybacteria bacterium]